MEFTWANPTRIIFGAGKLNDLATEAARLGTNAFIVSGKSSTKKSGLLDHVVELLHNSGIVSTVFTEIEPNPRTTTIEKGAALLNESGCDFIIGLGGGSPMDGAKGIAVAARNEGPFWDYVYHGDDRSFRQPVDAVPLATIPTLAATGSEANAGGVFTNWKTHEKAGLFHPLIYPRFSIIDPELTLTVPPDYTVDGGIDIISHVLESYCSSAVSTPLQDRFSEGVMRTVMQFLGRAIEEGNDLEARTHLSWASTAALCGLVNAGRVGGFPLHNMEHVLSGHYDISHGRGLAILMPHLMRFTAELKPAKYAQLARNIFFVDVDRMSEADAAKVGIDKFVEWMDSVGRKLALSDVGIDSSKLEIMAEDTIRVYGRGRGYIDNIRKLYKEDILKVFRMAL